MRCSLNLVDRFLDSPRWVHYVIPLTVMGWVENPADFSVISRINFLNDWNGIFYWSFHRSTAWGLIYHLIGIARFHQLSEFLGSPTKIHRPCEFFSFLTKFSQSNIVRPRISPWFWISRSRKPNFHLKVKKSENLHGVSTLSALSEVFMTWWDQIEIIWCHST